MAEDNGQLTNQARSGDTLNPPASNTSSTSPATTPNPSANANQNSSVNDRAPGQRRQSIAENAFMRSQGQLSPAATDRVFPIRSVVSVDPQSTPAPRSYPSDGYFQSAALPRNYGGRRQSNSTEGSVKNNRSSTATPTYEQPPSRKHPPRLPPQIFSEIISGRQAEHDEASQNGGSSIRSEATGRSERDDYQGIITARFKHVVTEGGHAIVTGRDGDTLQRCEDEPIHIPGAIQSFGLLIALEENDGRFIVRVVSENAKRILGYTPQQLFALDSFTDILSEDQADNLLDHIDFIRDEDCDVATNGPEVFTIAIRTPKRKNNKFWCAMHVNEANPGLIICEFELEDDPLNPLVPPNDLTPDAPEDTLNSNPTAEELQESTENISRPLRVLRSARKRKGEAAAMEVFNIMSQVQEQLASAPNLEMFLKVLVGVVKELTGFHRVMVYQFDSSWNGRVVTELVDPRATLDLYKGLNFPASDIPKQARDMYRINKVRLLYDRDSETARLVCRSIEDLETPLDMTYAYLRAMSPIHIKYLTNMAVRSSMSISINAFDELWGLIACHTYGPRGMRVSFPIRKMCRLVGDSASRNIERLSYASRLQARKLINTVPTQHNPSGYIIASSEDLLKLFNADFGLLSIRDETKILGHLEQSQEALAMLEYLRMRHLTSVTSSQDIVQDFPDLKYSPGFQVVAGMLVVPLSAGGNDFIVFFRKGQLREVKWAGNPYEKYIKEGTEGYLEPRKSFKTWSETVVGKCKEWTEEEVETAAVLCLVYGKFIEVWRQKEAALQNSQLTRLLLANSAHEVRTPLNAIINYLEIALEGSLDQETRENLAKSHSASKSLIYVINDLLDLTKTEEGVDLIKGEAFDFKATLRDASDPFKGDAKRKNISYEVIEHPGIPQNLIGDQRRVRQAISNIIANAIQHTQKGGVKVEVGAHSRNATHIDIEVAVEDTGAGMSSKKLDALFRELEQVSSESDAVFEDDSKKALTEGEESKKTLGLGLAVVARIVRNMSGQLRLKSEEGKGSRFVVQLPFDLPDGERQEEELPVDNASGNSAASSMSQPQEGELVMMSKTNSAEVARRNSTDSASRVVSRKNSMDSLNSRRSLKSLGSQASQASGKSDVDRLIEAIQEPHMKTEGQRSRPRSTRSASTAHDRSQSGDTRRSFNASRPGSSSAASAPPEHKNSQDRGSDVLNAGLNKSTSSLITSTPPPERRSLDLKKPGEMRMDYSSTPLKALKIPDNTGGSPQVPRSMREPKSGFISELDDNAPNAIYDEPSDMRTSDSPATSAVDSVTAETPVQASSEETKNSGQSTDSDDRPLDQMRVLVAEDDPVNSKIVKKRMEKLGHEVHLTSNGEECASAFGDSVSAFDAVLMDMQVSSSPFNRPLLNGPQS